MTTGTGRPPVAAPEPVRIDAFTRTDRGVYRDAYVEVRADLGPRAGTSLRMVRTLHFDVVHEGPRVLMTHRIPAERIDDDLSGLLADELFSPGWLRGPEMFERLFTGIVLTSGPDPLASWTLFYRNTLRRVETVLARSASPGSAHGGTHGTIDDYAPVYDFAERLIEPGSVLELGCCFGFLSLRLAAAGHAVTASDLNRGTIALLDAVSPLLGVSLRTVAADASRVPAPDRSADTVLLIHLLEHLDSDHGNRVLTEALRLARRRVVVGVPLEDEADETWGHVRTLSLADLDGWGRRSGLAHRVHEHHGGWLVLDR